MPQTARCTPARRVASRMSICSCSTAPRAGASTTTGARFRAHPTVSSRSRTTHPGQASATVTSRGSYAGRAGPGTARPTSLLPTHFQLTYFQLTSHFPLPTSNPPLPTSDFLLLTSLNPPCRLHRLVECRRVDRRAARLVGARGVDLGAGAGNRHLPGGPGVELHDDGEDRLLQCGVGSGVERFRTKPGDLRHQVFGHGLVHVAPGRETPGVGVVGALRLLQHDGVAAAAQLDAVGGERPRIEQ